MHNTKVLYSNAQYESTSFRLNKQNKDLKRLNKLEIKFTEGEKKINSSENELQIYKESKQLIRKLNRNPIKIT